MKKLTVILIAAIVLLSSCARGFTPYQAAQGGMKCGRGYVK